MARFVVDLGDIDMDRESQEALADEIQKVVLARVAELRIQKPFVIKFPIPFPGIILGPEFDRVLERVEVEVVMARRLMRQDTRHQNRAPRSEQLTVNDDFSINCYAWTNFFWKLYFRRFAFN